MKTLYFIRHAESEANRKRLLASRMAFPLTSGGSLDSVQIAAELKEITGMDAIISSPLKRALQTAESFSNIYDIDVQQDERVSEQELGVYSGMTYDQVKLDPLYEKDPSKRWNWSPEGGGESYSDIAKRVTDFLSDIEHGDYPERILIVTHAVALRLIIASLKNTLPDYPIEFPNNGEILKVEYSGLGRKYNIESIFLGNSIKYNHNP